MNRFLAPAALLAAFAAPALAAYVPVGELPDIAKPSAYRLDLTIDPAKADFAGTAEIDIELKQGVTQLHLHGNGLKMLSAEAITGRMAPNPATYTQVHPTGVALVQFKRPLPAGRHTLRFTYTAPFMTGTSGLYKAVVKDLPYAWTQFQAIDARRVFPGFDEPRHKTPFTVSITAPTAMKAFANAPEVSATPAAGGMVKHQFAPIGPMPTYLAALAVGEFDVAEGVIPPNDVRKVPLPHRTIATKGQAGRMGTTMAETPKILARLEQYFGIPYPWAKLDQIASPIHGGAMENNGLIVYDDTLLLLNADAPPSQLRNFGIVVAHELAHQWFGNGVTPRWWDDIWLNESFAEWMGNKIAADWRPDLGIGTDQLSGALGAMDGDSLAQGRPIRQPITDSAEINAAFDSITYQKGGQTIRMMSSFVGDDAWQKSVRLHLGRNWHGTATADEFFANIAEGAQDPRLVPAFRSFVDQQGVPLVTYTTAGGGAYTLTQQRFRLVGVDTPDAQWKIPVCAASGEARKCTLLDSSAGALPPVVGTAPWLAGNAGGAGYYRFDLPTADWNRLIAAGATLPAPEALTSVDSLWAGFKSGAGSFDRALAAARSFAPHPDRLVATYLPGAILSYTRRAGTPADRAAASAFVRDLSVARLAELGLDPARGVYAKESAERRQLRLSLASFAVADGRAPTESARLADAARKSLAGDAGALDPGLRVTALRAALREDPKLADRLFEALATSEDPLFRRQAASALGSEAPTSLLDRTTDKRLQNLEVTSMIAAQFANPNTRNAAMTWLEANLDTLKPRLGGLLGGFVEITSGFCSEADAQRVDRLFRPQMTELGIGELDLARPLASIRQCAALKDKRGADVSAALAGKR
ncbi:MAG: M1 family metallopeptidase [Sandaracinobacter sp.]